MVFGEDTPHDVFDDVQIEGQGDDQGDPRAAESGVAMLELDDCPDQRLRWTFGAGRGLPARGEEQAILALLQRVVRISAA